MNLKLLLFLLIVPLGHVWAQQGTVTGTVTSQDDGMPLPGATVIVVGTTTGTQTDFDGNYILENVPSDGTLRFSYPFHNKNLTVYCYMVFSQIWYKPYQHNIRPDMPIRRSVKMKRLVLPILLS